MAPFGDILSALENARQAAWAERSPMNPAGGSGSSGSGSGVSGIATQRLHGHRGNSSRGGHLPNSHSQPIYVPGKYSVCILEPYRYTSPITLTAKVTILTFIPFHSIQPQLPILKLLHIADSFTTLKWPGNNLSKK